MSEKIAPFLADTWWYGLTNRMSEQQFVELAQTRIDQGFDAVQLVVGIPPEVGPLHPSASSIVGPAWNLDGEINMKYLDMARDKILYLNSIGLRVIVYGAWGYQIDWIDVEDMSNWWISVIEKTGDLDVIYCLTGESNLWMETPNILLPDRSTEEIFKIYPTFIHKFVPEVGKRLFYKLRRFLSEQDTANIREQNTTVQKARQDNWSKVLDTLTSRTDKPFIIHPLPGEFGINIINNPQLLAANTVQTGHHTASRHSIWNLPYTHIQESEKAFINLEPWYEGIKDSFYMNDQVFAFWASMMAGATAYCYGAHGVWNVGDGKFLSHWGKQTFNEAVALDTPTNLGSSFKIFISEGINLLPKINIKTDGRGLLSIERASSERQVTYYTDISLLENTKLDVRRFFLPVTSSFTTKRPLEGQVITFNY
jgi:hypothetical protein